MEKINSDQQTQLLQVLQTRFEKNTLRHPFIEWSSVLSKLENSPEKLGSLYAMEQSGGEPDVVSIPEFGDEIVFVDCSVESPKGRRSLCYDHEAWKARKEFKPENNVIDVAVNLGIEILNESQYIHFQKFGVYDTKTSSWLKTPEPIRKLGGAIFAEHRYGSVFVFHNGAQSYYALRGFRGYLKI